MKRKPIPVEEFLTRPAHLWGSQWMLLTCGDFARRDFNTMTVAWGGLGFLWEKPCAFTFVRPVRHTYTFLERYDTFTLCAFPRKHREALELLGTRSGRDGDKIGASGLTPEPATVVASPVFAEAELAIECRKTYFTDLDPARFLDPAIHELYGAHDHHRVYFGEVLAVAGGARFRARAPRK